MFVLQTANALLATYTSKFTQWIDLPLMAHFALESLDSQSKARWYIQAPLQDLHGTHLGTAILTPTGGCVTNLLSRDTPLVYNSRGSLVFHSQIIVCTRIPMVWWLRKMGIHNTVAVVPGVNHTATLNGILSRVGANATITVCLDHSVMQGDTLELVIALSKRRHTETIRLGDREIV